MNKEEFLRKYYTFEFIEIDSGLEADVEELLMEECKQVPKNCKDVIANTKHSKSFEVSEYMAEVFEGLDKLERGGKNE